MPHSTMNNLLIKPFVFQTRETVFQCGISNTEKGVKNNSAQRSISDVTRGVWVADETMFDISAQSKLTLRSKQRNKIIKINARPGV